MQDEIETGFDDGAGGERLLAALFAMGARDVGTRPTDYDRTSIDLHSWLLRPKRGYRAELTRDGVVLRIDSGDYAAWIAVQVSSNWRKSVARHLAYLRGHVRNQVPWMKQQSGRSLVSEARLNVVPTHE